MLKSKNLSCLLLQICYCVTYCLTFGFLVAYLTSVGYAESTVGVILSLLALIGMVCQPIYGYLADKRINIKTILFLIYVTSGTAAVFLPAAAGTPWVLFLLCVVLGAGEFSVSGLIDCWCLQFAFRYHAKYEVARGVGSFGYALVAMGCGILFSLIGLEWSFYLSGICTVITLIVILCTEGVEPQREPTALALKPNVRADIRRLVRRKPYLIFLLCASMTFISSAASISFLIRMIELRGGTTAHLGVAMFMQAASEMPFMILSGRLLKKFNVRFLLVFSFFAYSIKCFAPAMVTTVWGVILVQGLQGLGYGIFLPVSLKYIALIAPDDLLSTANTLAVATYVGVGNILGSLLGGLVVERLGAWWIYILSGAIAFLSAVIFCIFGLREKNFADR